MKGNRFAALGRIAAKRRWWIVVGTIVFVIFAGTWGARVFGSLSGGGGFDDPASESAYADKLLAGPLERHASDIIVLYESQNLTVDDPGFAEPIKRALSAVPLDNVVRMESYWSANDDVFVSKDRHATYVTIQLLSNDDQVRVKQYNAIRDQLDVPGMTVRFGGITPMTQQVNGLSGQDIARAEMLSIPILLILLVFIFRSVIAATLPLALGVVVAIGSLAVLRALTAFVDISTFAVNVISILGLGLAIDYALFIVNRFREELAEGLSVDDAVERTMATAGRTVAFSGLTVAVSLACLIIFPSHFLQSMGYGGVVTVLFSLLSSMTVLPALLRFAGHRVNSRRQRKKPMAAFAVNEKRGRWYRVAHAMMRRPLMATVGIVILLVVLGLPFLGVNWARPGDWVLPIGADARVVTQEMAQKFPLDPAKIVTAVVEVPGAANSELTQSKLKNYVQKLSTVEGVTGAKITGTHENLARLTLNYRIDPMSREASQMVRDLRMQEPPSGAKTYFTGMPASRVDIVDMIVSRLPWMALFVVVVSFVVIFLAFGSVVLPLKSIILNLLSLSASFGAIKLIFQDGYLAGLLNFVPVGAVDINFPVLIVAIAFGLAMDYEVFLLSRVREEWSRSGDPVESVALGVQRTAKIITSAALLLVIVVGGFIFSGVTLMKMIGVGLVIAIVVDATIVRGLLVPATMRLLGHWAWWAPRPLAKWWGRYGIKEGGEDMEKPSNPSFPVN